VIDPLGQHVGQHTQRASTICGINRWVYHVE